MHGQKHYFFVCRVLYNHTYAHVSVNPKSVIHFNNLFGEKLCNKPHFLTGLVKSVVKYTDKSYNVEHAPHLP